MTDQALVTRAEQMPEVQDTPEGVTSLVRLAIDKGVDVEVLERLVALQERVTERNARGAYFAALADFQDKCPEIRKSKTAKITTRSGAQFDYTYAPLEEITRTIRPILRDCGLSYSWNVAADSKVLIVSCILRHVEGHEERASFPVPVDSAAAMSDAQKNGAALTYGRRQSLIAVLGLTTADQDVDGQDGNGGGEVEKITAKQVADLSALMDEVKADKTKFLRFLKVAALADLPAKKYQNAVRALEAKRQAGV